MECAKKNGLALGGTESRVIALDAFLQRSGGLYLLRAATGESENEIDHRF